MTMISANWGNLLEPGLRKAFFAGMAELDPVYSKLFNVQTSGQANEDDLVIAGLSKWGAREDTEAIILDKMEEVGTVTYTHETYREGFQIARSLWEDKKYGVFEKWSQQLGMGAGRATENLAAGIFNNGFSGGQAGVDGSQLFADAHALKRSSSTNDNRAVLALTADNLAVAITQMKGQLDEAGEKIYVQPKILLVAPGLEFQARKLIESAGYPGTGNNDINPLKGYLEVVVWPYLSDATAWFLVDPSMAELNFFWRIKPEFYMDEKRSGTNVIYFEGRCRMSCGFSHHLGTLGSTGGD